MPRGPKGKWRLDDPITNAVHIAKIATGQIEETYEPPPEADAPTTTKRAAGGRACATKLTAAERTASARRTRGGSRIPTTPDLRTCVIDHRTALALKLLVQAAGGSIRPGTFICPASTRAGQSRYGGSMG